MSNPLNHVPSRNHDYQANFKHTQTPNIPDLSCGSRNQQTRQQSAPTTLALSILLKRVLDVPVFLPIWGMIKMFVLLL